jgi:uncharacterized membrane protein YfcA
LAFLGHPAEFWLLAVIATMFVGAGKGGLPLIGLLSVPVMSLVMPTTMAAGLLLPLYVISDMYGLWLFRREYSKRNLIILGITGTVGVGIGWITASITNEDVIKFVVGAFGLAYIVMVLLTAKNDRPPQPASVPRGIFWGVITGFTSFASHSGGPPFQIYVLPQKLSKMVFSGTSTILFAYLNFIKLLPYWQLGQINSGSLEIGLYLAPVSLVGAWLGYKLITLIPQDLFFRVVEVALFIVSAKLIWDASWALLQR